METRLGSVPGGMKARPAAPRCSGQFRSHGYFIPWRPFLHRKMYEKFPRKGWKMENFSQRKLKTDPPTRPFPLLSSPASLQRNGLIQEITALPLLIYYVPSVYCPRLFPTYNVFRLLTPLKLRTVKSLLNCKTDIYVSYIVILESRLLTWTPRFLKIVKLIHVCVSLYNEKINLLVKRFYFLFYQV